jgi:hypothetical protein
MENLKVNDWVMYQGKKRQVAIVNGDGTVRLKSDDPTESSYSNGTIGCFHKNWLSPVIENKTAVEWLFNELYSIRKTIEFELQADAILKAFKQALEMEKQQMCDFFREGYMWCNSPSLRIENGEIVTSTIKYGEFYYNKTFKKTEQ